MDYEYCYADNKIKLINEENKEFEDRLDNFKAVFEKQNISLAEMGIKNENVSKIEVFKVIRPHKLYFI